MLEDVAVVHVRSLRVAVAAELDSQSDLRVPASPRLLPPAEPSTVRDAACKQKRLAEKWLSHTEADMSRAQCIDPAAGRITFRKYGDKWVAAQTTDPTTCTTVGVHLRLHGFPYLGNRPIDSFRPEHIREWLAELDQELPVSSYRRVIFASVSAVLAAAADDELLARAQ
ncbi:hypothetical protein ABZO31_08955 [Streptomyces sp. HUAS MG47]|uniref:hypothetical protein n=1 Tax=Streptomyces solicamelliae TaxID=3231716 RepID=UPI003877F0A7